MAPWCVRVVWKRLGLPRAFLLTLLWKSRIQDLPVSSGLSPDRRKNEKFDSGWREVIKSNAGSKRRRPISFSPLCSGETLVVRWPWRLNLFVETWIRRQGIRAWMKNCHLFHPLINLSELVCLRVIITCFSLWALAVVTLCCLYQRREQSRLRFPLTDFL